MNLRNVFSGKKIQERLKKNYFHIALLVTFAVPIVLLLILDYQNIEGFYLFNERFLFDETWKGRMFYLFFLWLLFIEFMIGSDKIIGKEPKNWLRILAFFVCASIPLIYVLSVNFLGMNQAVVELGQFIGINPGIYFTFLSWPLSFEYLVFFTSFLIAIVLAYKIDGLRTFAVSLSFLGIMGLIYMIDTYYPEGIFKPLQLFALPAAACAAALLEILGFSLRLTYSTGPTSLPTILMSGYPAVGIVWSCAGVHSLLIYTLIMVLVFKRSSISGFRKLAYFIVGAIGTYVVNILRIASFFVIRASSGVSAAQFFHDSLGELYFIFWLFAYILIILLIERFKLIEKMKYHIHKVPQYLRLKSSAIPQNKM